MLHTIVVDGHLAFEQQEICPELMTLELAP